MYASWLILFFFSGQYPHRLQWAYFVIISYYFLFLAYFVNNSHHYFWFVFEFVCKFYCDFVFVCFDSLWVWLIGACGFDTCYLGAKVLKQLIVFLCSFFRCGYLPDAGFAVLKILKFFISIFMFIFWFFVLQGEGILFLLVDPLSCFQSFESRGEVISLVFWWWCDFFGVFVNCLYFVNWKYFSLKLFIILAPLFVLFFFPDSEIGHELFFIFDNL